MRLFVNARAYDACDDLRLRQFLRYLVTGGMGDDEFCWDVEAAVRRVRDQHRWRAMRMRFDVYVRDAERRAEKRGMELGEKRGMERAVQLVSDLYMALLVDGREEEFAGALADHDTYERLLDEHGIGRDALGEPDEPAGSDGAAGDMVADLPPW